MLNKELRKTLDTNFKDYAIKILNNPAFDNSIVGISTEGRAIYNLDKMIEEFMKDNNCTCEEAIDYIQYNTIRAAEYYSDGPIIIVATIENILND